MLKAIHLLLLFSLCSARLAFAQEEDTMYPPDTSGYFTAQDSPILLQEQEQVYRKDSVDGKELDSITWKNLTRNLNYSDTLDKKEEEPEVTVKTPLDFLHFNINSTVTKYILFAAVIVLLLYLLYRLIGPGIFTIDTKLPKAKATFEILHDDEQMMQKDLHSLLEDALKNKDYKTAIRILFIQSLQDLQTHEWIKWQKEKTNRDYLHELTAREDVFMAFSSMVLLYEKAWYSESIATQDDLDAFNLFKQQIRRN